MAERYPEFWILIICRCSRIRVRTVEGVIGTNIDAIMALIPKEALESSLK